MTMQRRTAERIQSGKGWYWPPNSRKAHYYDDDNRTLCGRGWVFLLPSDMEGFDAPVGPDDCAACRQRVTAAQDVLGAPDHTIGS